MRLRVLVAAAGVLAPPTSPASAQSKPPTTMEEMHRLHQDSKAFIAQHGSQ